MYNGPIRGGSRGGRDQFNWESVKGDKDREFYIGHSVKASVGRWQKGKDILWYTRAKANNGNTLMDERQAVKEREEDLMLEALGIKKKVRKQVGPNGKLEGYELEELLRKGSGEYGAQQNMEDEDKVKGLGFKSGNFGGVAVQEVLEGVNEGEELAQRRRVMAQHDVSVGKDEEVKDEKKGLEEKHGKSRKEKKKEKKSKEKHKKRKKGKERETHAGPRKKSQRIGSERQNEGVVRHTRCQDVRGQTGSESHHDRHFPKDSGRKVQDAYRKDFDQWHPKEHHSRHSSDSRSNRKREPGHGRDASTQKERDRKNKRNYQDASDDSWDKGTRYP